MMFVNVSGCLAENITITAIKLQEEFHHVHHTHRVSIHCFTVTVINVQ